MLILLKDEDYGIKERKERIEKNSFLVRNYNVYLRWTVDENFTSSCFLDGPSVYMYYLTASQEREFEALSVNIWMFFTCIR